MSDAMDERKTDWGVMDVNEIKQKRRLMRILDAREKVEEKANEARELYVTGQMGEQGRNLLIIHAVREYIRECWTLLVEHVRDLDEGEKATYFAERELGRLEFPNSDRDAIGFCGLYDYLFCRVQFEETWQETVSWRHGQDKVRQFSETHTIPVEVSWQAFLTMNEFLSSVHDLEMQFEELDKGLETFGFETVDVSDLDAQGIEEVEAAIDAQIDARAMTDGGDDE